MGKIARWSAHHDDAPDSVIPYRWVHDETGQILEVKAEEGSEWYDVQAWDRNRMFHVNWESHIENKERARQHAVSVLRRHEDGQLVDQTEIVDDPSTIPLWKRDSTEVPFANGLIRIHHTEDNGENS